MSAQHQEGLAHLLYGINQVGGFVALTGEVGTGKTTLCQCLLQQLPDDVDIALVLNPKLSTVELLATICDELHIEYDKDWPTVKGLIDNLNAHLLSSHAKGRKTILLIDEAQNLTFDLLEQIRLLTNLETSQSKLLQIILVGQPELKELLDKPELRQLNQRITARFHLIPLTLSETKAYIKYRLTLAGGNPKTFKNRAIRRIYHLTHGIPRLINILCDRCLLGAYVNDQTSVTKKLVNKAAAEVFSESKTKKYPIYFFSLLSIGIGLAAGWYMSQYPLPKKNIAPPPPIIKQPVQQPIIQPAIPKETIKPTQPKAPATFETLLKQQDLTLQQGVSNLLNMWENPPGESSCEQLATHDYHCMFGKTTWQQLIQMQRPAILEFSLNDSQPKYALLTGLKNGNPVFQFNEDRVFSSDKVLQHWQGYFMLIWHSPARNLSLLEPGKTYHAVPWVRNKFFKDAKPSTDANSNIFDEELTTEILKFQSSHRLRADGIVGPKTFIFLQNNDPHDISPKLNVID